MKTILFLIAFVPVIGLSQTETSSVQLYFGDAAPGELCDKSSRVISIHESGEDSHDDTYTFLEVQFVVDGMVIAAKDNVYDPARGYVLSSTYDKGLDAQESGTEIYIVAKVWKADGVTMQFSGTYEVR